MNLKERYKNFLLQLQNIYSSAEATTITDWIFEHILHITKSDLIKNPDHPISESANHHINIALKELLQHKPVQYILGEAWFYKMKFKVDEHVLIPRPETEELVELVIDNYKNKNPSSTIIDIGTGSGCIAVSLKKNIQSAMVSAIDISKGALKVSKENAVMNNTEIHFIEFDFLDESKWPLLPLYDIIVSNPPYIPSDEKRKMHKNVTSYEPHQALFVPDETPLLFYEKIAHFGKKHLNKEGKIFVEVHEDYANETAEVFRKFYKTVHVKKDMFGKDRMMVIV